MIAAWFWFQLIPSLVLSWSCSKKGRFYAIIIIIFAARNLLIVSQAVPQVALAGNSGYALLQLGWVRKLSLQRKQHFQQYGKIVSCVNHLPLWVFWFINKSCSQESLSPCSNHQSKHRFCFANQLIFELKKLDLERLSSSLALGLQFCSGSTSTSSLLAPVISASQTQLKDTERYWKILKDTERYWKILKGWVAVWFSPFRTEWTAPWHHVTETDCYGSTAPRPELL